LTVFSSLPSRSPWGNLGSGNATAVQLQRSCTFRNGWLKQRCHANSLILHPPKAPRAPKPLQQILPQKINPCPILGQFRIIFITGF